MGQGFVIERARAALAVVVCFAIAALEGYDIQALGVAAPSMAPALHMPEAYIGWAGSLTMAGLILGSVVGGWAADRIGRKPVLVASVVWFGVFSILTATVRRTPGDDAAGAPQR